MADTTTWLVTGASRGLGLETTRQLLQSPSHIVIATCRTPEKATALHALKNTAKGTLHVLPLDTASLESIEAVVKPVADIVGTHGLDYLVNNAGMNLGDDKPFNINPADFLETMRINVLGPAYLAQTLLPLLERGAKKTIANVSSSLGSIALADGYGTMWTSYCTSKTALNMLTYKQSRAKPDFTVLAICPGWVKTDMGGPTAALEPEESISGVLNVISTKTKADSGKFFSYDGSVVPY